MCLFASDGVRSDFLCGSADQPRVAVAQHHARGAELRGAEAAEPDAGAELEDGAAGAARNGAAVRGDEGLREGPRARPERVADVPRRGRDYNGFRLALVGCKAVRKTRNGFVF